MKTLSKNRLYYIVLFCLCFLPVIVFLYNLFMYLTSRFPSWEEIAAAGIPMDYFNYDQTLFFYQGLFYTFGFLCLIAAFFKLYRSASNPGKIIRESAWFPLFALLLLWSLVCTFTADDPAGQFLGGTYLRDGLCSYLIYGAVFICSSAISDTDSKRKILILFTSVVSFLCTVMFLQFLNIEFLLRAFPSKRAVVFNQFNHFGYVLAMSILAVFGLFLFGKEKKQRALFLLEFAFQMAALIYNDTFGSYLAVLITLPIIYLFYYLRKNRFHWKDFLPVVFVLLLSFANSKGLFQSGNSVSSNFQVLSGDISNIITNAPEAASAGTSRFTLWKDTLERIRRRPIFGFGPAGFVGKNAIHNNDSPHNEYLQIAGFLGIPGLLLYLSALVCLAVNRLKHLRTIDGMTVICAGPVIAYLISACFGNPVFNTYPYFWMFLGFVAGPLPVESEYDAESGSSAFLKKALVILSFILILLISVYFLIAVRTENQKETADLQTMRAAESYTLLKIGNEDIEPGNYWFDAYALALIPEKEDCPSPYGSGTIAKGEAYKNFLVEFGGNYPYNEYTDYTSKIIEVVISGDTENPVSLRWTESVA